MALSEQDKDRIREEEAYRMQVRRELLRESNYTKTIVFWAVLLSTAILLFLVVHYHS
jgi:hypothetical protein